MPEWYSKDNVRDLVLEYYVLLRVALRRHPQLLRTRCCHCGIFFATSRRNVGRDDMRCPFSCRDAHRKIESTKRSVAYNRTKHGKRLKSLLNQRRNPPRANTARLITPAAPPLALGKSPPFPFPRPRDADHSLSREDIGTSLASDSSHAREKQSAPKELQPERTSTVAGVEPFASHPPLKPLSKLNNSIPDELIDCAIPPAIAAGYEHPSSLVIYLMDLVGLIERRRITAQEIIDCYFKIMRQRSIVKRKRIDYILASMNGNSP